VTLLAFTADRRAAVAPLLPDAGSLYTKQKLFRTFSQPSFNLLVFFTDHYTYQQCYYVTQEQAVGRNIQNVPSSSSGSQHEGPIARAQLLRPSTPTGYSGPNPTNVVSISQVIGGVKLYSN